MKKKKTEARRAQAKRFNMVSIALGVLLTAALTAAFIHFDVFTYRSVFYEYSEQEQEINDKIYSNTHEAKIDSYGDLTIAKNAVSSTTVSYFESEEMGVRILAYKDSDGSYRTAFDKCQSCREDSSAFYELDGILYCAECGVGVSVDSLGEKAGAGRLAIPS